MEVPRHIPEILRSDCLALRTGHGIDLYENFRCLLHRMHKSECQVKVLTGAKHPMVRPDCDIILLHQFTCRHCNLSATRHHPADDTDSGRKYNRTFCRHLPELPRKHFVRKRQYEGQRNHIRRVRMINDPMSTHGNILFHFVIHQMAWQLTRRTPAMHQPPADAVFASRLINFQNAGRIRRIKYHISEILSASGHHKIFPGQLRHICPDLLPLSVRI